MAVRVPEADPEPVDDRVGPTEPAMVTTLALSAVLFALLLANGRPAVGQAPPVPALVRDALPVDETGLALAGKAVASLLASLAGGVLFKIVGRRWTEDTAVITAGALVQGKRVAHQGRHRRGLAHGRAAVGEEQREQDRGRRECRDHGRLGRPHAIVGRLGIRFGDPNRHAYFPGEGDGPGDGEAPPSWARR